MYPTQQNNKKKITVVHIPTKPMLENTKDQVFAVSSPDLQRIYSCYSPEKTELHFLSKGLLFFSKIFFGKKHETIMILLS
jgi:hypothetical protein